MRFPIPTRARRLAVPASLALGAFALALGTAAAQAQSLSSFTAGDLVVSVEGNGSGTAALGSAATGNTGSDVTTYLDNQAAPLTLDEFSLTGTSGASLEGSLALPTTASGSNDAISGEYGSSSEGTLQLSGNGQYLTIMGYGVNPAAYNSTYDANGTGTALAQSCSLTSCGASAVLRVVALVGADGSVNTSTALYNVFNTNNPRSAYTENGSSFYVSGQGSGSDNTGGVFYASLGSNQATPITGLDASGGTVAQDTREVQIYNNQLYVSADTKEGSGNNRDYVGTLGAAGSLPTSLANDGNGPTALPGFGNGKTGKQTVTAATGNSLDAAAIKSVGGRSLGINLSPENFFFASPDTLYVADSGDPKNDSADNSLGDGGLQKWSLVNGSWVLDYTLSDGLDLVPNTASDGVSGLYGLTGEDVTINGIAEVELFATSFTLADTDQTYLYGITDEIAELTLPTDESFTVLAAAPADSTFKGVAFAPVPEPSSLAILGLGVLALPLLGRRRNRKSIG